MKLELDSSIFGIRMATAHVYNCGGTISIQGLK